MGDGDTGVLQRVMATGHGCGNEEGGSTKPMHVDWLGAPGERVVENMGPVSRTELVEPRKLEGRALGRHTSITVLGGCSTIITVLGKGGPSPNWGEGGGMRSGLQ